MRPFKTPFLFAAFSLCLLAATKASSEKSPSLSESTELFKEWIAMEKLVSKENSDWELAKNSMKDLIELLSEERSSIDEKLEELEKDNSAGEEARIELADENEALKNAILPVQSTLASLEKRIVELSKRFPEPLLDDLAPFLARIPDNDDKNAVKASVSQRLQAIVGALAKIDKFNSSIALTEKLLPSGDGKVKVMVLHFGLGIAYYSDEKGQKAGYMLPESDGWVEYEDQKAGPAILEAISFYNRTAQKQATFVELPFRAN